MAKSTSAINAAPPDTTDWWEAEAQVDLGRSLGSYFMVPEDIEKRAKKAESDYRAMQSGGLGMTMEMQKAAHEAYERRPKLPVDVMRRPEMVQSGQVFANWWVSCASCGKSARWEQTPNIKTPPARPGVGPLCYHCRAPLWPSPVWRAAEALRLLTGDWQEYQNMLRYWPIKPELAELAHAGA